MRTSHLWLISFVLGLSTTLGESITLFAPINGNGIRGTITWIQEGPGTKVTVLASLETMLGAEETEFSWAVHEYPVNYGVNPAVRCDKNILGSSVLKFDEIFGKLTLPTESTISLTTDRFNLTGTDGIWSHSLIITAKGQSTCSTIDAEGDVKFGVATFTHPMAGNIYFQSLMDKSSITTAIFTDMFHVNQDRPAASDHNWKLFITEYKSSNTKDEIDCNSIQLLWDPESKNGDAECSKSDRRGCAAGDLTEKHGKVRIGARQSLFSRKIYLDDSMPALPYEGRRKLYVVIFHPDKSDNIVGCARVNKIEPKRGVALANGFGAKLNFTFVQNSPFHPTKAFITGRKLGSRAGNFHVHLMPKTPKMKAEENICGVTGGHWNPYQVNMANYPTAGSGTDDQFELGDLSGKYGPLTGLDNVTSSYSDTNLPLFGSNTILGRSIVIHRNSDGGRWICGNIENTKEMITAVATFKYPLVGHVYFMQEANSPFSETSIFVSGLQYSDGSKNDSMDHRWGIHTGEISKDFYDWRNRCISAGPNYNPFKVNTETRGYSDCGPSSSFRCEVGDLSNRLGKLAVSGTKNRVPYTRRFYTDLNLPLTGPFSIIGKSIVLKDENWPVHRGERLGCTMVHRVYRVKAVAKDWFSNGEKVGVTGKFEFIQETPFSPVRSSIMLKGLGAVVNNFHVHETSIPIDRSAPCSDHAVGGHFNPFRVNATTSPSLGSPDQFEVGDLSGKFGGLKGQYEFEGEFNDTNMELIAPHSILGRSVVLHKRDRNIRWACADVVRGFSPSEATEIKAIASFHHPDGYVWGFVTFSQLVYTDGSLSDTTIEVNLKHPGQVNRNATRKHNWSVYVNQVAHDAAVKSLPHRCIAAGLRWNPYFVHLADPNNLEFYSTECSPQSPLRCDVGDLSGRLGPINIGENKYVKADVNLPLSGPASILRRSLVIHAPNGGPERFACANIEPDKDIIKYANIRKQNSFILDEFIDDVRKVLGVPDWMLTYDHRQTKEVYDGECIQLLFHFRGHLADKIEQDFDRLLNGREVTRPSLEIHGVQSPRKRHTKLSYRTCSSTTRKSSSKQSYEETRSLASRGIYYRISSMLIIPLLAYTIH